MLAKFLDKEIPTVAARPAPPHPPNLEVAQSDFLPSFPTIKARELLRILQRKPLSCLIMRTRGSHRTLRTPTGRTFHYAHHDAKKLSGHQVRNILMDDLGLTEKEALEVSR